MRERISWLHFSDIHFRASDEIDQVGAFAAIEDDLGTLKEQGLAPDLVFVTGDLAFAGEDSEYPPVIEFLDRVGHIFGLGRDRFFICPGNHDCDRNQVPTLRAGWIARHRSPETSHKALLSEEGELIQRRQAGYRKFLNAFFGNPHSGIPDSTGLHYQYELRCDELNVAVLSLNSSWLCHGGEEERGELQAGFWSVNDLLRKWPPSNTHLTFVLLHHPFDWLVSFESVQLEDALWKCTDVLLRGHVHLPRGSVSGSGEFRSLVLTAGAVTDPETPHHCYSWVSLDIADRVFTVQERSFDLRTRRWTWNDREERFERGQGLPSVQTVDDALRPLGFSGGAHAHLTCVLSGMKGELAMELHGQPTFLALSVGRDQQQSAAAQVLRIRSLCKFYEDKDIPTILTEHRDDLAAYVEQIEAWRVGDTDFFISVGATYEEAERVLSNSPRDIKSYRIAHLRQLVAIGDAEQLDNELTKFVSVGGDLGAFSQRLLNALSSSEQDVLDSWSACDGDTSFSVNEFGALVERFLLVDPQRAKELLLACGRTHRKQASQLREIARTLATELGDGDLFSEFNRIVDQ